MNTIQGQYGNHSETVTGTGADDHIFAYGGDDVIYGLGGNDTIEGGDGNDTLYGGSGSNDMSGGEGDDTLISTSNSDMLGGGNGNDTYIVGAHYLIIEEGGTSDTLKINTDFIKASRISIENIIYLDNALPLPYWIDALVADEGASFSTIYEPAKTSYFGFPEAAPSYLSETNVEFGAIDKFEWQAFSEDQKDMTRDILSHIASFIDLNLVETNNVETKQTFSYQNNNQTSISAGGYAVMPANDAYVDLRSRDVFIDNSAGLQAPTFGTDVVNLFIHETLHAFGLKHPGYSPAGETIITETGFEFTRLDLLSTMDQISIGTLDLAALHYLYGVNKTARATNDTYVISEASANFIWDGSGTDTLDASGLSTGATVYLEPGYHGFVGTQVNDFITAAGQITVNFGTEIENIAGSAFADQLYGNKLNNTITGNAGNDQIIAGAGNDIMLADYGSDTLTGGAGLDTAKYTLAQANYTLSNVSAGSASVAELNHGANDTLINVERIVFSDKAVALDIGNGETGGSCYRIYKAAFNRTPDEGGLGYWIGQMDLGMALVDVSARFIDSDEFRASYGTNPSNGEFLIKVYNNVLSRDPDEGGYDWWVDQLASNPEKTWQKVLADFSESTENQTNVLDIIGGGVLYDLWVA
jgi:Ca2+-binding RTX toxin-like protein|tara:strand:+ start:775 stop:2700 length:1926 start_codon:yes stop_codon:yes gene_type:complete